ncbi:serine hydrolase domain-containing protein [Paenibacillus thermotolerans]|uniref:serine hydrolase domain-containing protein n=1 Tax=Paenibacillus thermotolerans TaxID=3027807 RepID=UPI00236863DC|nr:MULTISPECIES: serine hydrolase domain-containing protein [unclassified Paenibacillus]
MRGIVKGLIWTIVIIVLLAAAVLFVLGRETHGELKGSAAERMDQYLTNESFRGVVLAAKDGGILFEKGYGLAAEGVQNTPQTLYHIASLSKSFTAVAMMQLAEQGKLSLDDPLSKYIADFPGGDNIKISHLLSHSSGIPDYMNPAFSFDYGKAWEPEQIVDVIRDATPDFEPGSGFRYSNSGYVLLGLIIEHVSVQSYEDYIAEHIFAPAGMEHATFTVTDGADAATGYVNGEAGPAMDDSAAFAAGNLIATAEDLAHYDRALRGGKLLSPESLTLMETEHASKFPQKYGYGWFVQRVFGHDAVGHSGGYPSGFRHYMTRVLDEDITVIVLSNDLQTNSKAVNRTLLSILLERPIWIWEKLI